MLMKDCKVCESEFRVLSSIPRWHFAMLNDNERNEKLKLAMESSDMRDKLVLDIGTGTGFLSMLAVQNGAKHVYTCEVNPYVAKKAEEIISINGYKDKITVINKLSTDLILGFDLPDRADVLISETVDCGFFGEGFAVSLTHALRELLHENALLIPSAVRLNCCLINSEDIAALNCVPDNILGFDLSSFNEFQTPGYFPVRLNTWNHKIVSNVSEIMIVDFQSNISFDKNCFIRKRATASTQVHGVLFWFNLSLAESIELSNSPENNRSHWMQAVQLFEHPVEVKENSLYHLHCFSTENGIVFKGVYPDTDDTNRSLLHTDKVSNELI
ncbi:50S ribosomal protein L11 methyltransferase [Gibbsiella quercinecans]|uniref:50S ribosomal protein L11 methyltransferase n=1 Tax=Gibbsiella quercinecans TaxID=929813 RepID=UPI003A4DE0D4